MSKTRHGTIAANNNKQVILKLAASSVKSSKMRNFFIVVTIILSVSLLMVMALFYAGMNREASRKVEKTQHVIYEQASEAQLAQLTKEKRTEYVLAMKTGQSMEIDRKMVQPVAYGNQPFKDEGGSVETVVPTKGETPQNLDEAMMSDAHCKALGIPAEPGQKVSFLFLDGNTESFVVTGIYHVENEPSTFPLILSEEYAKKGTQLKNEPYKAIVRIKGAVKMQQEEFLETIRGIAEQYEIPRKYVNENNQYLNTLAGGDMQKQETILVVGVAAGVLVVSVLVINSVFYLAVVGRIKQFGQLRTIGMTQKQIRKMVRLEGLTLCSIGIPIAVFIGGGISYLLRPAGWDWTNFFFVMLLVALTDLVTVLISIRKPAQIAASISPVEASKFSDAKVKVEKGGLNRNKKINPVSLAFINRKRSQKRAALTMISLGVGGVLFMVAAVFVNSTNVEEYGRQGEFQFGEFSITPPYNVIETAKHGLTTVQQNNPLNEELKNQIQAIAGVKEVLEYKKANVNWSSHGDFGFESIAPFTRAEVHTMTEMLEDGNIDYDKLLEQDQILLCYNDLTKELYGWEYKVGDSVELSWYDGEKEVKKEFQVAGILDTLQYTKYSNSYVPFILPEEKLNTMMNGMNLNSLFMVRADRTKEAEIEKELQSLIDNNPMLSMGTAREMIKQGEESFNTFFAVILGLSIFIIMFSVLNMLNTLITNILTRKHEFAMFQSIGMTTGQLSLMIQTEGLILVVVNLIITAIVGSGVGYVLVKGIRSLGADYMHFVFPGWMYLGYAAFTIMVPVVMSAVMTKSFQKEALVDRLR